MDKDAEPKSRPTAPERAEACETWKRSWDEYFASTYPPSGNRPIPVYGADGRNPTEESAELLSRFIADEAEYRQQETANRERFSRPSRVTMRGWEGRSPDQEITTLLDLRDYVRRELNQLRELGIGDHEPTIKQVALGAALDAYRNTWRAFDHLKVGSRPARLSSEPINAEDVERELSNLHQWMIKFVADEQAELERFCERRPPLDLAAAVFVFAKGLLDALERESNPNGEIGNPRDWRDASENQRELRYRLTLIRGNIENPPEWLRPVVAPIQRIARISDSIDAVMADPDRAARGDHWHYQLELRQAASHLWRACQALTYPRPADVSLKLNPTDQQSGTKVAVQDVGPAMLACPDPITIEDFAELSGVAVGTIQNKPTASRPKPSVERRGRQRAVYRYSEMRSWASKEFPPCASRLPDDYQLAINTLVEIRRNH